MGLSLAPENRHVTRFCDERREKYVRLSLGDTVKELSVAEDSQDILAPETMMFCKEWPDKDSRLNLSETETELRVPEDSQKVLAQCP